MIEDREYLKRDLARIYTPHTRQAKSAMKKLREDPSHRRISLHRLKRFLGLFQQKTAEKPCKFQELFVPRSHGTEAPGYGCQFPKDENKETEVSVGFRFFVSGLLK